MFPCPVCDVKLNSAEQLRAHCRGKNHIKREEARKKAEELGTDFDSTPDHCNVCNVPLTSKMTAIDHFKGKMHQKKVKALEEQRVGFKNHCEVCEVRLQSLKVSEAHFSGKQHHKRERKAGKGQGKKSMIDRKSSNCRVSPPSSEDFSPSQNIFGVVFEENLENFSSWENLNWDNDSEPNDPLSEFRNILNGKSLNSPSSSNSSSPETSVEPFFSFDNSDNPLHINNVHGIAIAGRRPPVVESTLVLPNALIPYFKGDDLPMENTALDSLWESQENFHHLNRTCNPTLPLPNTDSQCMNAQSEHLMQAIQAVVNVLRKGGQGISSGDIATKIAGLSPSDVNWILSDLEKHHLVTKSGYAPILWSLVGSTDYTVSNSSKQSLNGFSHPEKIPFPKQAQYFETPKDSYCDQKGYYSTSEANTALTAAILASCSITTTAPGDIVRPYANVIESNLVHVFQQCGSLTVNEMKAKLDIRNEARLLFILQKLLERNVIVKDGDKRWRLAGSTQSKVGVIGEERKRRSPVQSERSPVQSERGSMQSDRSGISRDRTPTPPKENSHRVQNGYMHTAFSVSNGFHVSDNSLNENGNCSRIPNGFHISGPSKETFHRIPNGFHASGTSLNDNGNCARIPNGFHASGACPSKETVHRVPNGSHVSGISSNENGNCARIPNGFHVSGISSNENGNCARIPNGSHVSGISSNENGNCARIPNDFHVSKTFLPKNGYVEVDKRNGFWTGVNNEEMNAKVAQIPHSGNNKQRNRSSPPPALKTETSEALEDLTVTSPKSYHRELYKIAMQEDTVCYLPCGTGKDLVMAQVIAHMAILNPTKHALVIVPDIVTALNVAQVLRQELGSKNKRTKLNVALHAGQLKQSNGKVQVVVATPSSCLGLLNCGALSWKDVCLLIFDHAVMCCNDDSSKKILHQYYLKAKMDFRDGHVPKLLSFLDSSAGQSNLEQTVRTFENVSSIMGDVFLSCVSESVHDLQEDKREAMFVCVQTGLSKEESRMFLLLGSYLNLVFDNLAAQWQPLNSYRELLKISFKKSTVISEAFVKLIHLTGQPPEKRLSQSCLKTWRHYLAICEVIFSLVECGEDLARELLVSLTRKPFGFAWANDVGLPGFELSRQLMEKEILNLSSSLSNPRGSGLCELLDQLMIIQWENARVSSERPLALVIVKLNKTAKILANYLVRCPELVKRNVKTTFVDGSRSPQQKAVISAIKRRQYQVIVSTDNMDEELPHCELVVLLDQPTSVYALEELRTRRATNVVAICRDDHGEDELKELLRREELVEKAITRIRAA